MSDNNGLIDAIIKQLPDAPFEVLEFVYYYLIAD